MSVFWRKERKCWEYDFVQHKERHRGSGFQTKRAATEAEARLREQLKSGKYIQEIPTFRELALKYLRKLNTYHTPHWASQVRWKINKYFPSLFDLAADQITADVLQEILSQLKDNKRARTLNELRKILRAVFNFGKKNELITHNPADKLPVFPEDSAPRYIPSPANFRKVLQVASPEEKVHLFFLKNTMCRIGASLRVGWCDVNFAERWVTLRTRKTRGGGEKSWRVPINTELLRALKQLKKHSQSDFLFATIQGKTRQQYPRYLKKLCKRAKVKPFTFHSIRHYSATMAGNKNAPLRSIQTFLGHERISTTSIYLQSLDDALRFTAEVLCDTPRSRKKSPPSPHQEARKTVPKASSKSSDKAPNYSDSVKDWRRERDLNPRYPFGVHTLSRRAP
jgi:integrase